MRKEHCWGRCAASADIMTNFLPGGPVSLGRIVSCPLPSRHHRQCSRSHSLHLLSRISVGRTSPGCGGGAELSRKFHIFWVFGRQRRCFFVLGLHVSTNSALSICSSVQNRLRCARELFRSSSLARFPSIGVSPRCRRPPRVPLHGSENHVSLYPRQLSMRRGFTQRMLLSKKKKIIKNPSLMRVHSTFTTILSWVSALSWSVLL